MNINLRGDLQAAVTLPLNLQEETRQQGNRAGEIVRACVTCKLFLLSLLELLSGSRPKDRLHQILHFSLQDRLSTSIDN